MPDLSHIQADFCAQILSPEIGHAEKHIAHHQTVSATARLRIYHNTSQLILIENLASTYPISVALLGADLFAQYARRYIQEHPPSTGDMSFYGDLFPEMLTHTEIPYLQDIAHFEWQFYLCYFDTISPAMMVEDFGAIAPEILIARPLVLQDHIHFVPESKHPLDVIWAWHQGERSETLNLPARGAYLICFRQARDIHYWSLPKGAYLFLSFCKDGMSYQKAAEAAMAADEACDLISFIGQFTARGLFQKITTDNES